VNTRALRRAQRDVYSAAVTKFLRPPRRFDLLYIRDPLYFITCCAYRRRTILANDLVHTAFIGFAKGAHTDFGVAVGRYVIMPDHIHFFVSIGKDNSLGKWVGSLKQILTKSLGRRDSADPVWQRGFFDHVLRSSESYSQKWEYVRMNPVRAALVDRPNEWPFSGEIVSL
jgi:putative transposase